MTLYQIQYFRAVCLTGSVTEAAKEMNVTQPVISVAIKSLENECKVLLFQRYKRKLTLTKEGEKLFALSHEIIMQMNALQNRMEYIKNKKRPVTVGVSPMVGGTYFPKFIMAFKKEYPDIEVIIEERRSKQMFDLIRKEKMDLAFALIRFDEPEDIGRCLLKKTSFQLAVNKEHPLAKAQNVKVQDLQGMPMVLYKDNQGIKKRFKDNGVELNVVLSVDQIYTMKSYAISGMAATILLEDMIKAERDIRGIPLELSMEANVGLMWKNGRNMYSDAMILMEYAKKNFCR